MVNNPYPKLFDEFKKEHGLSYRECAELFNIDLRSAMRWAARGKSITYSQNKYRIDAAYHGRYAHITHCTNSDIAQIKKTRRK